MTNPASPEDHNSSPAQAVPQRYGQLIGCSRAMAGVFALLRQAETTRATLLLEGEPGTGKLALAVAQHQLCRPRQPLCLVDCQALTSDGLIGLSSAARAGTLFLHNIDRLPLETQTELLRRLTGPSRGGSDEPWPAPSHLVSSSSVEMEKQAKRGRFLPDLLACVARVRIKIPPLRNRREDIAALVSLFLAREAERCPDDGPLRCQSELLRALQSHDWPGNVAELEGVVVAAVRAAHADRAAELTPSHLASLSELQSDAQLAISNRFDPGASYRDTRSRFEEQFEQRYVSWLLDRHQGNLSSAARDARMDRKHLYDLARKHGLRRRRGSQP